MAISIIVAGVVAAVFVNSWRANISQRDYIELQEKGRTASDEITNQLKVSSGVVSNVTSNSVTYSTTSSSIVLKTPSIDANEAILTGTDYFIFRINPNDTTKLQRIIIADPASTRASITTPSNINDRMGTVSFTYYDATGATINPSTGDLTTVTKVSFTVNSQKVSQGRTISRSFDNLVYLRNKQ